MSDSDTPRPKRKPYQITDDATWAKVRQTYLGGGLSAQECAEKFDVSVHAIRKRITTEGWGKRAFANAVGPSEAAEQPAEDPFTVRRVARPAPLAVEVGAPPAEAEAPSGPGEMATAAFDRAARAFAAGRTEEAQRLLKLAEQARRMADQAKASGGPDATYGAEPRYAPDEVVVTIDKLFEMTERWAAMIVFGELGDLPAFLVQLAAHWRRANLVGPLLYGEDMNQLKALSPHWFDEVYNRDGSLKPLPPDEDLAVYIWGHRDFADRSQWPPMMRDREYMEARRARIAAGKSR